MSGAAAVGVGPAVLRNFARLSALRVVKRHVEPIPKWRIVTGDTVFVNTGRDRGTIGKVKKVLRRKNRLVVEGVNFQNKRMRATQEGSPGGIIQVEGPIHYSNVNLIDPSTNKPTRVGVRWAEDGTKVRVSAKTDTVIPYPPRTHAPKPVDPGPRDTAEADVRLQTYFPPAELLPYLARAAAATATATAAAVHAPSGSVSLFRLRGKDDLDRVPGVLQRVDLRRHIRNRMRGRWQEKIDNTMVAKAVAAASAAAPGKQQPPQMR